MEVLDGDGEKIDRLNEILCQKAGFPQTYEISVQTYSRKVDLDIANAICGLGSTAIHITNDIRHLASMKQMEEPFEKDQIGSSAMAYKRNPMRCERICSLGRKLRSLPMNFADTYADQWFERTLDDSAIRRIDIPEVALLADAILIGLDNVSSGLVSHCLIYDGFHQPKSSIISAIWAPFFKLDHSNVHDLCPCVNLSHD